MEQNQRQLRTLEFELSYPYSPSSLEVGFDSRSHEVILEELKRHGFIDNKLKPLVPFEITSKNEVIGPNGEGEYIVTVQYVKNTPS